MELQRVVVELDEGLARRIGRSIQPVVSSSSQDTVSVELRTQVGSLKVTISTFTSTRDKKQNSGASNTNLFGGSRWIARLKNLKPF